MRVRRHGIWILCLLFAGEAGFVAFQPEPVEAGSTSEDVEDFVAYPESNVVTKLRLMVLSTLQKTKDTDEDPEPENLATGDDIQFAVYCTTTMRRT